MYLGSLGLLRADGAVPGAAFPGGYQRFSFIDQGKLSVAAPLTIKFQRTARNDPALRLALFLKAPGRVTTFPEWARAAGVTISGFATDRDAGDENNALWSGVSDADADTGGRAEGGGEKFVEENLYKSYLAATSLDKLGRQTYGTVMSYQPQRASISIGGILYTRIGEPDAFFASCGERQQGLQRFGPPVYNDQYGWIWPRSFDEASACPESALGKVLTYTPFALAAFGVYAAVTAGATAGAGAGATALESGELALVADLPNAALAPTIEAAGAGVEIGTLAPVGEIGVTEIGAGTAAQTAASVGTFSLPTLPGGVSLTSAAGLVQKAVGAAQLVSKLTGGTPQQKTPVPSYRPALPTAQAGTFSSLLPVLAPAAGLGLLALFVFLR